MKQLVTGITLSILFSMNSFAQTTDTLNLKVCKIKDLKDCYIISCYSETKSDSIYLISIKPKLMLLKCGYKKIHVGGNYDFECKYVPRPLIPTPITLMIKNTIVWQLGDDPKKVPIFSPNSKGLFVKKLTLPPG